MQAIIVTNSSAEEIAALVLAVQGRQGEITMSPEEIIRTVVRSATDDMQTDTTSQ